MPTSCITGSVCSAGPPQCQLWMSGDGVCCQPHLSVSGPCRDVFSAWLLQRGHSTCICASQAVLGLLSSGSNQHCWEVAAGHQKGGFGPRGSSKRNAFGIGVPLASSSLVCLIPVSPSPHQSGLELQWPVWHQKAAAAAALPGLRETSQLLGEPGISSLPVALPQGSHSPAVPCGSWCWITPGKAPGMCQLRHC